MCETWSLNLLFLRSPAEGRLCTPVTLSRFKKKRGKETIGVTRTGVPRMEQLVAGCMLGMRFLKRHSVSRRADVVFSATSVV